MQPTLPWILATLSAVLFLAAAIVWRLDRRPSQQQKLPAEWGLSARPVFSADERRAYRQLREALPHHVVLAKLPLVRFCQPVDPQEVRYWYELLGSVHVSFAICSANGRVLAAIDLESDHNSSRRSAQIKQAVLAACRVRYLRCVPEHMPSIPELQLLVPQATTAARGPQAATAGEAWRLYDPAQPAARRREFATLWKDSASMEDGFLGADRKAPAAGGVASGDGARAGHLGAARAPGRPMNWDADIPGDEDIGGVVIETPSAPVPRAVQLAADQLPTLTDPVITPGPGFPPIVPPPSQLRH